jgi:hypothetical protein
MGVNYLSQIGILPSRRLRNFLDAAYGFLLKISCPTYSTYGRRGNRAPAPYVEQAPIYIPAQPSICGRVHTYYVPIQTYYAPPVYYRPHYYGRRHRWFGY